MKNQLIKTNDGSHSLYVPELDEIYHSTNGAIQESKHVFIDAGLKQINKKEIAIFEAGFGTGLNALLSLQYAIENNIEVHYYTIEKYPVDISLAKSLNYHQYIDPSVYAFFIAMHETSWEKTHKIHGQFNLTKHEADLVHFEPNFSFDLVYFDAFAPDKQPELWENEVFQRFFQSMHPGGILTTYSVKGAVKRNLKTAGFRVEKIPGPPGKREMLRATKPLKTVSL